MGKNALYCARNGSWRRHYRPIPLGLAAARAASGGA